MMELTIGSRFLGFVYRNRLAGKRAVSALNRLLPRTLSRPITSFAEKVAFLATPDYQGDTLPPIFHYWARRYVLPKFTAVGLRSPEDMYFRETVKYVRRECPEGDVSIVSFGSGAARLELNLIARLHGEGIKARIECVDFNPSLGRKAELAARHAGVGDAFHFRIADCNSIRPSAPCDIVIVNEFFHHVENLEVFCAAIRMQLKPAGVLLTCDVVGRNGHVLWPTVDGHVQSAWRTLDKDRRYDRYFGERKRDYMSVDHSSYSNEGIRSQDIVEVLLRHFDFELFLTYAGRIMPFVERRIGFNFSEDVAADREFIDRIAEADEVSLECREYPASLMTAVLRHRGTVSDPRYLPVSPQEHVRLTQAEKRLADGASRKRAAA